MGWRARDRAVRTTRGANGPNRAHCAIPVAEPTVLRRLSEGEVVTEVGGSTGDPRRCNRRRRALMAMATLDELWAAMGDARRALGSDEGDGAEGEKKKVGRCGL